MKVNDNKFDKAYHDPLYMDKKLSLLEYKLDMIRENALSLSEQAHEIRKDLANHRKNMREAIDDKSE